jgi:acetyltransferase-like isoleucine patch superfamily enzyme
MTAAVGADAVVPEPARLGGLRLALMRLRHRGRLRVGSGVRLGRDAQVRIARGARVVLEDGCYLGPGCRVEALEGTVRVGAGALVGARTFVIGHRDVVLGAGCVVGDFAAIGIVPAPGSVGQVTVGERARVGAHATVASGASLPAGAVLGSYEGRGFPPGA